MSTPNALLGNIDSLLMKSQPYQKLILLRSITYIYTFKENILTKP